MIGADIVYPHTKPAEQLAKEHLRDTLSTVWALTGADKALRDVVGMAPLRSLPASAQECFLMDAVVSLTKNRVLMRHYARARGEQLLSALVAGDGGGRYALPKQFAVEVGAAMGVRAAPVGDVFSVGLVDYIKASAGAGHASFLPVNQVVIEGTVRLPHERYARVLSQLLVRRLDGIMPLKLGDVPRAVQEEAAEIRALAEKAGLVAEALAPSALRMDACPPCVKAVLSGVSKGSRNFAVSMFLTSFLSHARLLPPIDSRDAKVQDFIDPQVLLGEIMPLIEGAAEGCRPPLFTDSPQERENVMRTLGLDREGRPAASGKMYTPPNCARIKQELDVCQPDGRCAGIKNPLQYYVRQIAPPKQAKKTAT